jgi:homoserine O-succinyltransferase
VFVDAFAAHHMEDRSGRLSQDGSPIVIGLVNIMPPAAMKTIESLFARLLNSFDGSAEIQLRLFALPNRNGDAAGTPQGYENLDALWRSPRSEFPLDGLIVTGTEARSELMTDEANWPDLQKICDWAGENTISTVWSCFSAHAAVLHIDNIHRQKLAEKLTGVFECDRVSGHPIVKNMPARWAVPHSRYNTLNEAELVARGYEILSRSPDVGADSFIKQHKNSQFLFLQGHLEYGPDRLLAEYCRDLKRYALGQRTVCPKLPENYLDQVAIEDLAALQNAVQASADAKFPGFIDAVTARLSIDWQAPAQQLFASWLFYIGECKAAHFTGQPSAQPFGALPASERPEYIAGS